VRTRRPALNRALATLTPSLTRPRYWSIHYGSCGHNYLWPDQGTGWDVVALSDRHPDYAGRCV
jgi:hypothetical protein